MGDEGIVAIYYNKSEKRPYLVTQDTGQFNIPGTSILRWNPMENNFYGVKPWYEGGHEAFGVFKFHVNYLIKQAKISIKKRDNSTATFYDDLVDYLANAVSSSEAPETVQNYFIE